MLSLNICDKEHLVSGKWGNTYSFTCNYENHELSIIIKNNSGAIVAKWMGKWVIAPSTPNEIRAARDILEFLFFRNSVSQWMKEIG